MGRKYELKKRAERQEQTRLRIVEAAIALHTEIGPAQTTISAIAEHAGVQRHTVYRHFPDERDLVMACSGLHLSRHPLPDPEALLDLDDPEDRVRRAVELLYAYYAQNERLMANLLRDVVDDELTQFVVGVRVVPVMQRLHEVVTEAFRARGRRRARLAGAVAVALDFHTWQTLTRAGLDERAKIETATAMTRCQ
jgi:AcrR family transcriptional regulator